MNSTRHPLFLSVPSEIKDRIYNHVVTDACLQIDITPRQKIKAEIHTITSGGPWGTVRLYHMKKLEVGHIKVYTSTALVALLLTCRQTNYEVQHLYTAATEKLVIRCAGIMNEAGYGWIGGFSDGEGRVAFSKVSDAIFAPRNFTTVLKRLLTLRKNPRKPEALLSLIQHAKTVVVEHWDSDPKLWGPQDPMQRARKATSITAYGDAFWEWVSLNNNIQSVVVHSWMTEWDKEERKAVFKNAMKVAWNMEADRLIPHKLNGPLHNAETRWHIISDSADTDGSNEEQGPQIYPYGPYLMTLRK